MKLIAWWIALLLAGAASAQPVHFTPDNEEFRLYTPGVAPANAVEVEFCVYYEGDVLPPYCENVEVTPGEPTYSLPMNYLGESGYVFHVYRSWWLDDETTTAWELVTPPVVETLEGDITGDGAVGGPDFTVVLDQFGCDVWSSCP